MVEKCIIDKYRCLLSAVVHLLNNEKFPVKALSWGQREVYKQS